MNFEICQYLINYYTEYSMYMSVIKYIFKDLQIRGKIWIVFVLLNTVSYIQIMIRMGELIFVQPVFCSL